MKKQGPADTKAKLVKAIELLPLSRTDAAISMMEALCEMPSLLDGGSYLFIYEGPNNGIRMCASGTIATVRGLVEYAELHLRQRMIEKLNTGNFMQPQPKDDEIKPEEPAA